VLAQFLDDRCTVGPRFQVPIAALYRAYVEWCEQSGERPMMNAL
jgi:phage/plasmid-associated DNA primase